MNHQGAGRPNGASGPCRSINLRNATTTRGLPVLAATLLLLGACSSDGESDGARDDESLRAAAPLDVLEAMMNSYQDDEKVQGWRCVLDDDTPIVYVLGPRDPDTGATDGRVGVELDERRGDIDAQSTFAWAPFTETSVVFDEPLSGERVTWEEVQFSSLHSFTTRSTRHGLMRCGRTEAMR